MHFWKKVIRTFLLLPLQLLANDLAIYDVDTITGELELTFTDTSVKGAKNIKIERGYYLLGAPHGKEPLWKIIESIGLFPHLNVYLTKNKDQYFAEIIEKNEGNTRYLLCEKEKNVLQMKPDPIPQKYLSKKVPSPIQTGYRNDKENNRLYFYQDKEIAILHLENGGSRYYTKHKLSKKRKKKNHTNKFGYRYLLEKEISPDGTTSIYSYTEKNSICIKKVSPHDQSVFSWIKISFCYSPKFGLKIESSDHQTLFYEIGSYNGRFLVKSLIREGYPTQYLHYKLDPRNKKFLLEKVEYGRRKLEFSYFFPEKKKKRAKIHKIFKDEIPICSYSYNENSTKQTFISGSSKKFTFANNHLQEITTFDKNNQIFTKYEFCWTNGLIKTKLLKDSNNTLLFSEHYIYDTNKNLTQKTISNHNNDKTSTFKYDKNHLCIEEKALNRTTYFQYIPGTNIVCLKKTDDYTKSYLFDKHLLLIEERDIYHDFEKVTTFTYNPTTKMLQAKKDGPFTTFYTYDTKGNVTKESTAHSSTCYTYDNNQRMIQKILPSGVCNEYSYDKNGNVTKIKEGSSDLVEITYNEQDLPILYTKGGKQKKKIYDGVGNLLQEVDYAGRTTSFVYDEFNRCIKKELPEVCIKNEKQRPSWSYEYDCFGNKTASISPSGKKTSTVYNLQNKPTLITYPDNTTISYTYDLRGNLLSSTLQDGSKIHYSYNSLDKCILKEQDAIKEKWEYNGFLLNSYTNKRGLTTYYYYDEYGRIVAQDFDGRIKLFSYDNMGNLCKIDDGATFIEEKYDQGGRLLERKQNQSSITTYQYHEDGSTTKQVNYEKTFFYDRNGKLVELTNSLHEKTLFYYEDFSETKIEPCGNKTIKTFDAQKRLIEKKTLSSQDKTLQIEKIYYDEDGNIEKKMVNGKTTTYLYDAMGRVLQKISPEKKKTLYQYDSIGLLTKKTLPNKTTIAYGYDSLGRKKTMHSSDGSINYVYLYQEMDLVQVKDLTINKSFEREYSKYGELIKETNCFGFTMLWDFDSFGRIRTITLPDRSSIHYEYKNGTMTKNFVESTSFAEIYEDEFSTSDEQEEELLTTYNIPNLFEDKYDALGRIITSFNELGEKISYQYDPFSRLIAVNENGYITYFLYDGDKECATILQDGKLIIPLK